MNTWNHWNEPEQAIRHVIGGLPDGFTTKQIRAKLDSTASIHTMNSVIKRLVRDGEIERTGKRVILNNQSYKTYKKRGNFNSSDGGIKGVRKSAAQNLEAAMAAW